MINIVTATYNCENTIEQSILSVLSLNIPLNYIIIDGESRDNTVKIIKKYSDHIDYFISEKDDGIYDAWNKALNYIKKGWIIFLGADDFIIKENFVSLSNMIKGDFLNYDLICSRCTFIDENGNSKFTFGENFDESKIKKYMCVANPSLLYNTSMFDNNRFCTDYKICADYDFLIRKKNLKTFYNPNPITKMTSGGSSNSIPAVIETFKIRAGIIPFYLNFYLSFKAVMILFVNK